MSFGRPIPGGGTCARDARAADILHPAIRLGLGGFLMRTLVIALLSVPLIAAAQPQRGLTLQVPQNSSPLLPVTPGAPAAAPRTSYAPAPLPNRDLELQGPRASDGTSVAPSLFMRGDQYRGEGYSRGSTSQSELERRVKPGAGINLRMPLTGQ